MTTSVKEKPILFSAPMIRAILAGEKTQTRRVIVPPPPFDVGDDLEIELAFNRIPRPYRVGMHLWVRETWRPIGIDKPLSTCIDHTDIAFAADADEFERGLFKWRSSIFMPRWASRISLEVTEVRAERLQDISEEDAIAEGIKHFEPKSLGTTDERCMGRVATSRDLFAMLWDSINQKRGHGWEVNPYVWVIEFKRLEAQDDRD